MAGEPGAVVQHGGQSELGMGTDAVFLVRMWCSYNKIALVSMAWKYVSSNECENGKKRFDDNLAL